MSKLHLTTNGPIGLTTADGFEYRGDRPAKHCGICGDSFQPWLARTPEFATDTEVQWAVQILIDEWTVKHNNSHTPQEHLQLNESGNLMTPEAAIKLIPLGIYPIGDMVYDSEVAQAALEAPRAPTDDVRDK